MIERVGGDRMAENDQQNCIGKVEYLPNKSKNIDTIFLPSSDKIYLPLSTWIM